MGECEAWDGVSPTFLWPRTPPGVALSPQTRTKLPYVRTESEDVEGEDRLSLANAAAEASEAEVIDGAHMHQKKMKANFYHVLATKRAAAMDKFPTSSAVAPLKTRSAREKWKTLLSRGKAREIRSLSSRRDRFSVWSSFRL